MKRSFRTIFLLALSLLLLTVTALADTGPKSKLTVKVKNAPQELYYLDLLSMEGAPRYPSLTAEELAALDADLYGRLLAAIPAGWHGCVSQGTDGAPIWGDLTPDGDGCHSFGYYGVPWTYRVLMVTKSGETFLSEVQTRRVLQSSVTVDWAAKTLSAAPVWVGYVLELLATLVPTLLLEGALLALLGLWNRRNLMVFLAANAATQLAMFLLLGTTALKEGVGFGYYLLFIPLELVILLAETVAYRRLFTGASKRRATVYGISANLCSAVLGWFLAEPIWKFIVTIS